MLTRQAVGRYGMRTAAAAAAVAALATGCSGQVPPPQPPPAVTAPEPAGSSAGDHNVAAGCFDSDCEIEVSSPVELPLHPRSRIAVLRIDVVGRETVRVQATYVGGGYGEATVSRAGTATLNDISVQVIAVEDGTARLDLSPA